MANAFCPPSLSLRWQSLIERIEQGGMSDDIHQLMEILITNPSAAKHILGIIGCVAPRSTAPMYAHSDPALGRNAVARHAVQGAKSCLW
jgi:hypothetical protein